LTTTDLIIIGFGRVGQSLAQLLDSAHADLKNNYGIDIKVVAIVDREGAAVSEQGIDLSKALSVKRLKGSVSAMKGSGRPDLSPLEVIEEEDGDIVVEATSTNLETGEPRLTHIEKALSSGRHVVTTNKGHRIIASPLNQPSSQEWSIAQVQRDSGGEVRRFWTSRKDAFKGRRSHR